MKDKHIHIPEHSRLQKRLRCAVHEGLHLDRAATTRLLWAKGAVYAVLLVAAYAGILTAPRPALLLAAYVAYGLLSVLLGFNFAHDFSHHTVFRSRRANDLCFTALYTLLGAHAEGWQHRHVHSHHYAPNVRDYDTDLQITSLIRVEPGSPLRRFHRYQHLYAPLAYTTYSVYWVLIKDFVVYFGKEQAAEKGRWRYHASFWLQKAAYLTYLLALPLACSSLPPWTVVAAFGCMHATQSLFLLFTFFMTHHVPATAYFAADADGFIPTSWLANQVRSSNDFYPFSRAANFVFGGFNNHIAHHLFPHIHHVHYPALNRIIYPLLHEEGMTPNVTGYWGGVIAHLRHLRNMGRGRTVAVGAGLV